MTEDIPYILATIAKSNGRFLISTILDIMIIAPQKTPAAPSPAMALPMMNTGELGAAAQSMEPASKIIDEARYTHFKFQKVYILPNAGWAESWVRR
ncbi:unnamed protein product [Fusarium graminearum]|nr:unnamed protein product [Fusarium graminearum]